MIRNIATVLEKALILEERIDYAGYILEEQRALELLTNLKFLLDSEATTVNISNVKDFIEEHEEEILRFDQRAQRAQKAQSAQNSDKENQ